MNNKNTTQQIEYNVVPLKMALVGTASFWKSVIYVHIELELIPCLYTYHLQIHHKEELPKEVIATNGTTVIYATIYKEKMILTKAYIPTKPLSREQAELKGYEWYRTKQALWIDKSFHFLRAYQQYKFNLALIVPAYYKAKGLMPNERLIVDDGDSKVVITKKDACTLVLLSGIRGDDFL